MINYGKNVSIAILETISLLIRIKGALSHRQILYPDAQFLLNDISDLARLSPTRLEANFIGGIMKLHTHDSIRDLINKADVETRRRGVFTCSPMMFKDLWFIHDDNGRYIMEDPKQKNDPPKVLGFTVVEKPGYKGLTFEIAPN